MTTTQILSPEKLQIENMELRSTLVQRDQKIVVLDQKVICLQEQLDWFKRQIFGQKSERIARDLDKTQMRFEGFDVPQAPDKEQIQTVPAHERRKPRRDGQDAITLPEDLPVKTVVLDIPDAEKVCKETGIPLVHIGNETTHKLAHEPGSYYIKEIIRPKYAHPQKPEDGVLTAELPDSLIPKCRADESLLAEVVVQKFADHMPLYRIAESMGRVDIQISRKLLSQWVITWFPCYVHIRRKFFEAESGDLPFRDWVLRKIKYLFMLERVAWARSPEERLKIRQEKEIPIIDELIQKIKDRLMGHSARKLEELLPDQWLLARNTPKQSRVILTRQPV